MEKNSVLMITVGSANSPTVSVFEKHNYSYIVKTRAQLTQRKQTVDSMFTCMATEGLLYNNAATARESAPPNRCTMQDFKFLAHLWRLKGVPKFGVCCMSSGAPSTVKQGY